MYQTEKEIFNQYEALNETYNYFLSKEKEIKEIQKNYKFRSITFIGSGSSYYLCKSAEISCKMHLGLSANSIAAGDLMLNFSEYKNVLKDTLLVMLSRSGSTSEVILALQKVKEQFKLPSISISARENSKLSKMVDLSLEIPWAFDESVCQTRTVTNLYTSILLMIANMNDNEKDKKILLEDIKNSIEYGNKFIFNHTNMLKEISQKKTWSKVVILADSELEGIAAEAALAFKEISNTPSNYYHVLDVRHGPMVLIDKKTLVIIATSPYSISYQADLVTDLKRKGAEVLIIGSQKETEINADYSVNIPVYQNYAVRGIPFVFVSQAVSFFRAASEGINPDVPQGLDSWIELKESELI